MPFDANPESFKQLFLGRLVMKYVTAAEFDKIVNNPKPLAGTFGKDAELLYIEVTPSDKPFSPRRTFINAEYSPVSKWKRWLDSWRINKVEFNAGSPEKHDGEWYWWKIQRQQMGKYGDHETLTMDHVPTAEESKEAERVYRKLMKASEGAK